MVPLLDQVEVAGELLTVLSEVLQDLVQLNLENCLLPLDRMTSLDLLSGMIDHCVALSIELREAKLKAFLIVEQHEPAHISLELVLALVGQRLLPEVIKVLDDLAGQLFFEHFEIVSRSFQIIQNLLLVGKVALFDKLWFRQVSLYLIKLALERLNEVLVLHVLVSRRLVVIVLSPRRLIRLINVLVVHFLSGRADGSDDSLVLAQVRLHDPIVRVFSVCAIHRAPFLLINLSLLPFLPD